MLFNLYSRKVTKVTLFVPYFRCYFYTDYRMYYNIRYFFIKIIEKIRLRAHKNKKRLNRMKQSL